MFSERLEVASIRSSRQKQAPGVGGGNSPGGVLLRRRTVDLRSVREH